MALANWIVDNAPGMDVFAMDAARFGDFATPAYAGARVRENYGMRFSIAFPNEVRPAGRPLRTTPVYDRMKAKGAVFGVGYGLETPLWFAPKGTEPVENLSFRRSNAFAPVAAECRAVREKIGIMEISGFAKYEITGSGANQWLDGLLANRLPKPGRMALAPMLDQNARLQGDLTIAHYADSHFFMFGSGVYEGVHRRWFEQTIPDQGVQLRSLGKEMVGFAIAGPNARELLRRLSWQDVSGEAFPFLSFRDLYLGMVPAKVARISFTGELGYEIWVSFDYQIALYEALLQAGSDLGLRHFGSYALNSLRLEKSFGGWTREFRPDYTPLEAGLDRFVKPQKGEFRGKDAFLAQQQTGAKRRLITLTVDNDNNPVDPLGDEPVYYKGDVVGWVTSGGFGHYVKKSIALAYVATEIAEENDFEVEILGKIAAATRSPEPLFDPSGERMRS